MLNHFLTCMFGAILCIKSHHRELIQHGALDWRQWNTHNHIFYTCLCKIGSNWLTGPGILKLFCYHVSINLWKKKTGCYSLDTPKESESLKIGHRYIAEICESLISSITTPREQRYMLNFGRTFCTDFTIRWFPASLAGTPSHWLRREAPRRRGPAYWKVCFHHWIYTAWSLNWFPGFLIQFYVFSQKSRCRW